MKYNSIFLLIGDDITNSINFPLVSKHGISENVVIATNGEAYRKKPLKNWKVSALEMRKNPETIF